MTQLMLWYSKSLCSVHGAEKSLGVLGTSKGSGSKESFSLGKKEVSNTFCFSLLLQVQWNCQQHDRTSNLNGEIMSTESVPPQEEPTRSPACPPLVC